MPILNSLGALTYPKVSGTALTPVGGFATIATVKTGTGIRGYSVLQDGYGLGIGADSNDALYTGGYYFLDNPSPTADTIYGYVFKFNDPDGQPQWDGQMLFGSCYGAMTSGNDYTYYPCENVILGSPITYRTYLNRIISNSINSGIAFSGPVTAANRINLYGITNDSSNNVHMVYKANNATNVIYIAKFDSSNASVLRRNITFASGTPSFATGICVDSSNNIYVCAFSNASTTTRTIFKWDSSGTLQWQKTINTTCSRIAADSNYVYLNNDRAIILLNSNNGTFNTAYKIDSSAATTNNRPIIVGSDGYIYTQLRGNFYKIDTSGNVEFELQGIFNNVVGSAAPGPFGTIGIAMRNNNIFVSYGTGYEGYNAICSFRVPNTFTENINQNYWLGSGYFKLLVNDTVTLTSDTYTSTTSTFTTGSGATTIGAGSTGSLTTENITTYIEI